MQNLEVSETVKVSQSRLAVGGWKTENISSAFALTLRINNPISGGLGLQPITDVTLPFLQAYAHQSHRSTMPATTLYPPHILTPSRRVEAESTPPQ